MNETRQAMLGYARWMSLVWGIVVVAIALPTARAQVIYIWNGGDIVSGSITPSGVTTITSVDTLNIVTGADHDIASHSVVNNGTVNWSAGRVRGGGAFTNNGQWNDSASSSINQDFGAYSFINSASGTYLKTAGDTAILVAFSNAGVIRVTGGTLSLASGGLFSSGSVVGSSGPGVLQLTGGTLAMTGSITATNFVFNGGNFAGDQAFNSSVLNWQTGTWNSANTTTIASGSTLAITTGSDHDFQSHVLVNNGTVNWSAGRLRAGLGGTITNNAAWNDTANNSINNDYGGLGGTTFDNAASGTYLKSTGNTAFLIPFTNSGTISVTGGTLDLQNGGTFNAGSVFGSSGPGLLQLSGGTLTVNGAVQATNFLFNGGNLTGDQTFTASTLNWKTGSWNSASTTTLSSGTVLTITSGSDHDFPNHLIINNGTVNWTTGRLRSGSGGTITNNATWNDTASYAINNDFGGVGGTSFINAVGGTYNKISGVTTFLVPLSNYGTVAVSGGTLSLAAGGTFFDGSSIGSSGLGVAQLTGGVLSGGGLGGFTATNFLLTSGQLAGNMTFLGTTNWVGSNFNTSGTATIGPSGTLLISSGNDHDFDGHAVVNNGTVNWVAGRLRSGDGGTITNRAVWNDSANGYAVNNDFNGMGGTSFINAVGATYNKTAGVTAFLSGILVNNGTIGVSGGELDLVGGTFNDGSSIGSSGNGLVQLTSGLLTATGTINVQNFIMSGGQLTGDQTFAGTLTWNAGNWNTAFTTTIGGGSTLSIGSGADHDFQAHALVNNGTVNWTSGRLRSGSGGTITNHAVWNDSADGYAVNNDFGGMGGTSFINAVGATYNKTAGVTAFLSGTLVNNGTIGVSGGEIDLVGGTFNDGSSIGSSGNGLVRLTSGLLTASGTINTQNFIMSGGQLTGDQTFAGTMTWNGGDWNTAFTTIIGGGSTLSIASGADHDFNGHAIVNNGTVDWTTGRLRSGSGGTITNAGTWNDTGSYAINNDFGGAGGTNFINGVTGTYNKTAGSTSILVPFTNAGTVNVNGGALAFTSTFSNASGTVIVESGSSFSATGPLTFGTSSLLRGNGTLTSPSLSASGTIFPGTVAGPGLLTITSAVMLAAPSQTSFRLGGTGLGTTYDHLTVNGAFTAAGNLRVVFTGGFEALANNTMTFDLIGASTLAGAFANVAPGTTVITTDGLATFVVNYGVGSPFGANDVVLSDFLPVPEPSTYLLLLGGLPAIFLAFRRRFRS
ncbi:MAG: PEP-CTERM sorting domain-containing protein [Opitutaceae bacterium]